MQKTHLVGLDLKELELLVKNYGFDPSFALDICKWVYRKGCKDFNEMNTIPLMLRQKLDHHFSLKSLTQIKEQNSVDGTKKYLFHTSEANPFETAFMPGAKRNTLCISTQSGCRMGCGFCFTSKLGLIQNLSAGQIIDQLLAIRERSLVNRIVLMGMGEPLDNHNEVFKALKILNASWGIAFGAKNITLSTVGLLHSMKTLVDLRLCNIAVSLHNPFASQRQELMPVEADYPIHKVVEFFKENPLKKPLRLSFEYVVIPGENDSIEHAAAISNLLKEIICHVNVIPLNTSKNNSEHPLAAKRFQAMLNGLNQPTTLRTSRGFDIDAACGMMAGKGVKK